MTICLFTKDPVACSTFKGYLWEVLRQHRSQHILFYLVAAPMVWIQVGQNSPPENRESAANLIRDAMMIWQARWAISKDRFIEAGKLGHVDPLVERVLDPWLLALQPRLQGQHEELLQGKPHKLFKHLAMFSSSAGRVLMTMRHSFFFAWPTSVPLYLWGAKHSTHTNALSLIRQVYHKQNGVNTYTHKVAYECSFTSFRCLEKLLMNVLLHP